MSASVLTGTFGRSPLMFAHVVPPSTVRQTCGVPKPEFVRYAIDGSASSTTICVIARLGSPLVIVVHVTPESRVTFPLPSFTPAYTVFTSVGDTPIALTEPVPVFDRSGLATLQVSALSVER